MASHADAIGAVSPQDGVSENGSSTVPILYEYEYKDSAALCNEFTARCQKFLADYVDGYRKRGFVSSDMFVYYTSEKGFLVGEPRDLFRVRYVFDMDTESFVATSDVVFPTLRKFHVHKDMKSLFEMEYIRFPTVTSGSMSGLNTYYTNASIDFLDYFDPEDTMVITRNTGLVLKSKPQFRVLSSEQHSSFTKTKASTLIVYHPTDFYRPLTLFNAYFAEAINLIYVFDGVVDKLPTSWGSGITTNRKYISQLPEVLEAPVVETCDVDSSTMDVNVDVLSLGDKILDVGYVHTAGAGGNRPLLSDVSSCLDKFLVHEARMQWADTISITLPKISLDRLKMLLRRYKIAKTTFDRLLDSVGDIVPSTLVDEFMSFLCRLDRVECLVDYISRPSTRSDIYLDPQIYSHFDSFFLDAPFGYYSLEDCVFEKRTPPIPSLDLYDGIQSGLFNFYSSSSWDHVAGKSPFRFSGTGEHVVLRLPPDDFTYSTDAVLFVDEHRVCRFSLTGGVFTSIDPGIRYSDPFAIFLMNKRVHPHYPGHVQLLLRSPINVFRKDVFHAYESHSVNLSHSVYDGYGYIQPDNSYYIPQRNRSRTYELNRKISAWFMVGVADLPSPPTMEGLLAKPVPSSMRVP